MEFDFDQPILDLHGNKVAEADARGKPIKAPGGEDKHYTLGSACQQGLMWPSDNDTAETKVKKFNLALRLNGEVEISDASEIAMIKDSVNLAFGPLVVGRVYELLELKE